MVLAQGEIAVTVGKVLLVIAMALIVIYAGYRSVMENKPVTLSQLMVGQLYQVVSTWDKGIVVEPGPQSSKSQRVMWEGVLEPCPQPGQSFRLVTDPAQGGLVAVGYPIEEPRVNVEV